MSVVVCVCVRDVRVAVALGAEQRHDSSLSELIPSLMGGQPQALPTMPGAKKRERGHRPGPLTGATERPKRDRDVGTKACGYGEWRR